MTIQNYKKSLNKCKKVKIFLKNFTLYDFLQYYYYLCVQIKDQKIIVMAESSQEEKIRNAAPMIPISSKNEIDLIKKFIYHYSSTRVSRMQTTMILRPQLVTMLAFYFKYGYSRETKDLLVTSFNMEPKKGLSAIANMDLELKELGYFIEDMDNKRVKYLNAELRALQKYYNVCALSGQPVELFLKFTLKP